MIALPQLSDKHERARICFWCAYRRHPDNKDQNICTASGKNAWQHAIDCDCPKDRFPRIIPPKTPEELTGYINGPFKELRRGWEQLPDVHRAYQTALAITTVNGSEKPTSGGKGRGLIIVAGGRYALVGLLTLKLTRASGCDLPCEIWRLPSEPLDDWQINAAQNLNVTFRQPATPMRYEHGWCLKSRALLETSFDEVVFRDSDSYDLIDPAGLFDSEPYKETGALFWPDPPKYNLLPEVWRGMDLPFRWEPTFEAGQFIVDRRRCWRELQLTDWMCSHAEFYWKLGPRDPQHADGLYGQGIYGDKDCFHLAWRYFGSDYGLAPRSYEHNDPAVIHFDLDGKTPRIIHRIHGKAVLKASDATFNSWQRNERNDKLPLEDLYWRYLDDLKALAPKQPEAPPKAEMKPPSLRTGYNGAALWLELHQRALTANLATEAEYLKKFAAKLGCGTCREHWTKLTTQKPFDLSSRYAYARSGWTLHNDVGREIGNPEMSWENACPLYGWPLEEHAWPA